MEPKVITKTEREYWDESNDYSIFGFSNILCPIRLN